MDDEQASERTPSVSPRRKISPELVGAVLLAVVLVIFIVQNDTDQKVSWVVFNKRAPLWAVILVSALIGYLLGQLIEFAIKRRRRESTRR